MKIRLVGGPFGGKVIDDPSAGASELIYRGPKKISRKKKWELMADRTTTFESVSGRWIEPHVEARYRIAMGWFSNSSIVDGRHSTTTSVGLVHAPLRHPDGSLFYEYVEGSRREL